MVKVSQLKQQVQHQKRTEQQKESRKSRKSASLFAANKTAILIKNHGLHQVSVSAGMPKSCSDLWKIGHTLSGIYSVMGSDNVETVYCDFTRLPYEQGEIDMVG